MSWSAPQPPRYDVSTTSERVPMAKNIILQSSHVKYVLSAQFIIGESPCVVLVHESAIAIYALTEEYALEHLGGSDNFPVPILSARVVRNASMFGAKGEQLLDVLVLTLENNYVHFIAVNARRSHKLEFWQEICPIPIDQASDTAFGRHLAIHSPTLVVVSASSARLCVVQLREPIDCSDVDGWQRFKGMSLLGYHEMKLLNMEFFHVSEDGDIKASLACLGSLDGKLKLVIHSWTSLQDFHDQRPETHIVALDSFIGIPQVFCPLVVNHNAILIADESQVIVYTSHQNDPLQLEFRKATADLVDGAETSLNLTSSCDPPLWSSCAVLAQAETNSDRIYLVNENGLLLTMDVRKPFRMSKLNVTKYCVLGYLGSKVDGAFTIFRPDILRSQISDTKEELPDHDERNSNDMEILVFVGDGGDGGVWKIEGLAPNENTSALMSPWSRSMTRTHNIFNWAPLTDATLRSGVWRDLKNPGRNHRQGYQKVNELFATCGKHPYGGILQFCTGHNIVIDTFAEAEGLEEVESIWPLLFRDTSKFVASFPYGSLLVQNLYGPGPPKADKISDEPTLSVSSHLKGLKSTDNITHFVHVTPSEVRLVNTESLEHRTLVDPNVWTPLATKADIIAERGILISLHPAGVDRTQLNTQKLNESSQEFNSRPNITIVDDELSCICHISSNELRNNCIHLPDSRKLEMDLLILGSTSGKVRIYSLDLEDVLEEQLMYSPGPDIAIHSIRAVRNTKPKLGGDFVLHCCLRNGVVISTNLDLLLKPNLFKSRESRLESFKIPWILQTASFDNPNVIAVMDGAVYLLKHYEYDGQADRLSRKSLGVHIDRVLLTDNADPGFCAGRILAVGYLDRQLRQGSWVHRVLCVAQDKIFTGYLYEGPKFLTRRISVPGTPNRILYFDHNDLFLTASTVVEADTQMRVRFIRSILYLVDPVKPSMKAAGNASENCIEAFRCKSGQTVTSLLDWTVSTEKGKYNAIVVGTKDSEDTHESGSVLLFKFKRRGSSQYVLELQKTIRESRPVYAVSQGPEESLLYACGDEIKFRRWTIGEKESEKGTLLVLSSPAISMLWNGPYLHLATNSASAVAYSVTVLFLTQLFLQEDQARACLSQVPVMADKETAECLLVSDQSRRVALLPTGVPCNAVSSMLLHSTITKLLAQPPWNEETALEHSCKTMIAVATDGSITLVAPLWKRIRPNFRFYMYLQSLLEQDVRICPLRTDPMLKKTEYDTALNFDILERFTKLEDPRATLSEVIQNGSLSRGQDQSSSGNESRTYQESENIRTCLSQLLDECFSVTYELHTRSDESDRHYRDASLEVVVDAIVRHVEMLLVFRP